VAAVKTLGKIVEGIGIAALAATAVLTGVGVVVGGLTLGAAFSAATGAIGAGLGVSAGLVADAALVGIASVFSLLQSTPKPKSPETAVKVTNPPRVMSLGERRLYGAYVCYQTDPNSGKAVDVYAIHDCPVAPIDSISGMYLGDDRVINESGGDGPGTVAKLPDGTYDNDKVQIDYRLGQRTETAYSEAIATLPGSWDASHRGDGVCSGMVIWGPVLAKNYSKIYPKGQPSLSLVGRWSKVYDWRDESQSLTDPLTWKWNDNACLGYVFYKLVVEGRRPTLPFDDSGFAAQLATILQNKWDTLFAPTLDYWTAAADDCDSAIPITAMRTLTTIKTDNGDRTIHVQDTTGLAVGVSVSMTALDDLTHTETNTVESISGRTVVLSNGLTYKHPAGSLLTWQSTEDHPLTEKRYRTCATWEMTTPHKANLATILACFDGWVSDREDGALVCYSGRYYAPTITIGPDQIVQHSFDDGIDDENAVNELVLTTVSAVHHWATPECEAWRDEDDIDARGRVASQPLELQVPSYTQGRRLAKRTMARLMAPKRGTVTTNPGGRIAIGQRYITLRIIEGGATWYDGPAEITALKHTQTGIAFTWVAADPNVDAWNPATEEGMPAPIGNTAVAAALAMPTISSALPDFSAVSEDGTGVRIAITATGPDRDDLTWYARWRVQGSSAWNEAEYADADPGASVALSTGFVPAQAMIEVAVAYKVSDGRVSDWSDPPAVVNTATDQTPPDDATVPTLVSWTDSLNLQLAGNIARAATYRWTFYETDGTTVIVTHSTPDRSINYAASQARIDGVRRAYVVGVAGVNSAGVGVEAKTAVLSKDAPAAVTSPAITGGDTTAVATCDETPGASGYVVFYGDATGFDPTTTGGVVTSGLPSISIFGLDAGTYYGRVAAYDEWTANPAYLSLSDEIPFTITVGGGSTPSGGGGGGGGYTGGGGGGGGHYNIP